MDHSEHDCLVVAILSHGDLGILYAHDTSYKPDSIWSLFTSDRCPTLAGKPKLFFIQACQGDKLDAGTTLKERTETDGESVTTFRIPCHADFLIAYSTIPGKYNFKIKLILNPLYFCYIIKYIIYLSVINTNIQNNIKWFHFHD